MVGGLGDWNAVGPPKVVGMPMQLDPKPPPTRRSSYSCAALVTLTRGEILVILA